MNDLTCLGRNVIINDVSIDGIYLTPSCKVLVEATKDNLEDFIKVSNKITFDTLNSICECYYAATEGQAMHVIDAMARDGNLTYRDWKYLEDSVNRSLKSNTILVTLDDRGLGRIGKNADLEPLLGVLSKKALVNHEEMAHLMGHIAGISNVSFRIGHDWIDIIVGDKGRECRILSIADVDGDAIAYAMPAVMYRQAKRLGKNTRDVELYIDFLSSISSDYDIGFTVEVPLKNMLANDTELISAIKRISLAFL